MKKEILVAIFLGGILGLIIAFGIWRLNKKLKSENVSTQRETEEKELETKQEKIVFANLEEYEIKEESPIAINGITTPNTWIVLSTKNKDYFQKTGSDGSFSFDIEPQEGINNLLFAIDDEPVYYKIITFLYSPDFSGIKKRENEATPSSILEEVEEKIEKIKNKATSYIGTVTEKTQNTIEVKTKNDQIKQAVLAKDTVFIDLRNKQKKISFEDIAIGDFLAILGYKSKNDLLEGKRIILTNDEDLKEREILFAKINKIEGKKVSVKSANETFNLLFPKKWEGPEIKDLKEDDNIALVGKRNEKDFALRSIFILKDSEEKLQLPPKE